MRHNDRFTWDGAPDWWNPTGELVVEKGDQGVMLGKGRSRIPTSKLKKVGRSQ